MSKASRDAYYGGDLTIGANLLISGRIKLKRSAAVRAGFGVEAVLGEAEPFDRTAGDEVLGDDFCGVFGLDVAVPDGLGINDDGRSVLTLVEAEGLVDADG